MKSKFDNISDSELKNELARRAEAAKLEAKKLLEAENKRKSKIEAKWHSEWNKFAADLKKVKDMEDSIQKMLIEASEKHGFPVDLNEEETYFPLSIDKWKSKENFTEDEIIWFKERLRWFTGYETTQPGCIYWKTSYC